MGARKNFKTIFIKADDSDKVREMMIASANYSDISEFLICPKQEQPVLNRKRRLENLTTEEKILRKKLKNREAAQTSRDKKKAYLNNMEDALCQLRLENEELKKQIKFLLAENDNLKLRNSHLEKENCHAAVTDANDAGSAVPLIIPLPQGMLATLATMTVLLHLVMTVYSMLMTSVGSMTYQIPQTLMNWTNLPSRYSKKHYSWNHLIRKKMWWGPAQKSWNPLALQTLCLI